MVHVRVGFSILNDYVKVVALGCEQVRGKERSRFFGTAVFSGSFRCKGSCIHRFSISVTMSIYKLSFSAVITGDGTREGAKTGNPKSFSRNLESSLDRSVCEVLSLSHSDHAIRVGAMIWH